MSAPKKQTEFTFLEAKQTALQDLGAVIVYAKDLGTTAKKPALLHWATVLEELRGKIEVATQPCLADKEIRIVWDFAQILIFGFPMLALQISQFWSLHESIKNLLRDPKETKEGYYPEMQINLLAARIETANRFHQAVSRAAAQDLNGVLAVGALLMVHVARVETIEYSIRKQLTYAVKRFHLQEDYDPVELCSVEGKVPVMIAGKLRWQSDVRAIRDAAAHCKFEYSLTRDGWSIKFSNQDHGYNFERTFSKKDFVAFMDTHTLLYTAQFILLKLQMILFVLTTHFLRARE